MGQIVDDAELEEYENENSECEDTENDDLHRNIFLRAEHFSVFAFAFAAEFSYCKAESLKNDTFGTPDTDHSCHRDTADTDRTDVVREDLFR